jgi:hypothetical protein
MVLDAIVLRYSNQTLASACGPALDMVDICLDHNFFS